MADDDTQRAAALKRAQSQRPPQPPARLTQSLTNSPSANQPLGSRNQANLTPAAGARNATTAHKPSTSQQSLALAKSLASGKRDKSKSKTDQLAGEVGARAGQALGGTVGTAIPVVGSTVGAAVGKRVGRVAGEHWKKTLLIWSCLSCLSITLTLLPFLLALVVIVIILNTLGLI